VYSLFTDAQRPAGQPIPQDERQKYDAEFERQMSDFEQERKKFKEEHPDKVKEDDEDLAKYYEDATVRELRLIYEAQTGIHQVLQQMETRLREINQQQALHTTYLQQGR
jgi:lectin, mannose-binding 1